MQNAELVITAPKNLGDNLAREYGCRTTVGVIEQLLLESRHEILLAAPFLSAQQGFFAGEYLFTALRNALARGIRVCLFLSQEGACAFGTSGIAPNVRGGNLPQIFVPRENSEHRTVGFHAKVVVADATRAYIGSANLTEAGLNSNFELGLLVTGDLAKTTRSIWRQLVSDGFFVPFS